MIYLDWFLYLEDSRFYLEGWVAEIIRVAVRKSLESLESF